MQWGTEKRGGALLPAMLLLLGLAPPAFAQSGAASRQTAVDLYRNVYEPTLSVKADWDGDVYPACFAGTVDLAYLEAVRGAINYFREMAGLTHDIPFDPALSAKCQQSALITIARGMISRTPIPSWPCYTDDGAEAARFSCLGLGQHGPASIAAYIREDNTANVEHRRWILWPPQQEMGYGATTATYTSPMPPVETYTGSDALWVVAPLVSRPAGPDWVAWPPAGFLPKQLAPARWSLSRNIDGGADFTSATVTMVHRGYPVPLNILPPSRGPGDNTLVWEPQGLDLASVIEDAVFSVTVQNVLIDGQPVWRHYNVTIIDPDFDPPSLLRAAPSWSLFE